MIKGKAKLEFGDGSIQITPVIRNDGIGALCLKSVNPHDIGVREPVPDDWTPNQSDAILTFTNHESVLALIKELSFVYKCLLDYEVVGERAVPGEYWGRERELDFDGFMIPKPEPEFLEKNFVFPESHE